MGVDATRYIVTAIIFGTGAFVFSTVPFMLSITYYTREAKQSDNFSLPSAFITILIVHILSVSGYVAIVKTLMILAKGKISNMINKAFDVFWSAESISKIENITGTPVRGTDAEFTYSTLHAIYVIVQIFYGFLPFFMIAFFMSIGAMSYLKEGRRSQQEGGYYEAFVKITSSFVFGVIIYVAYAKIATIGLFIPGNTGLLDFISNYWSEALKLVSKAGTATSS